MSIVTTLLHILLTMAALLLVVVLLTPSIGQEYSHCMADFKMEKHEPSLYEQ